ncbi:flagellar basal body-associated FliL family protein [Candidatus Igneacidithiobacillus taiwanensis]|uniref:flagellar basal body-associated FliL family protein n=1 Tax=Candidatus Igneacidithiobacillus taiwanensis TaxID=1945924 RepID=UPI00289CEF54|nr:flagellar basal body-associated FliL family protein [Candidatus Igneacidithiobacillus taiwanensis]MCE5359607.1 flagellar basal body-associated FliL family protein [Acidithiobacillus sp.]
MTNQKKGGKKKLLLLGIIAVLLLIIIAAGAWWFLLRSTAAPSPEQLAAQRAQQTKFIDLGSLVTNLQSSDGATHYIQVDVQLKTYDPNIAEKIKSYMPQIRSQILQLLAAQQADKVSDPAVRAQLLEKIKEVVNQVLQSDGGILPTTEKSGSPPIVAAYFSSFVVQ